MQAELQEAPPDTVEEATLWIIPFNLSIDTLDIITKACYQAKGDTTTISTETISKIAGTHARTVVPNMRFLASIGVLVRGKLDKEYTLSSKGAEYAKSLGMGDMSRAGQVLAELLSSSHLTDLLGYVKVQGPQVSYESVFNHIKTLARLKVDEQGEVSSPFKSGIRCLISLLVRAGFVGQEVLGQVSDAPRPLVRATRKVSRTKEVERTEGAPPSGATKLSLENNSVPGLPPITINISIEARDPESIKQVADLLRQLRNQNHSD